VLVAGSGCGRCVVGCEHCSHPTTQRPTTTTNHIQQNQNNTPNKSTRVFVLLKMGIMMPETCCDRKLIVKI
jgi:hypothetical protein